MQDIDKNTVTKYYYNLRVLSMHIQIVWVTTRKTEIKHRILKLKGGKKRKFDQVNKITK